MIVANVFHAGDGNLHPLVCYDGAVEGEAERAEELSGLIIDACLDAGGSITGEHGVGVDKKKHMPKMFAEEDLDAFQRLRCAFDPAGLANPGKLMPTPRLCGEVPGPYRQPSAGGRRAGGALLMAGQTRPGGGDAAARARRAAAPCGRSAAGRSRGAGGDERAARDRRAEPHPRAQRRRLHRGARGRACRSPRRRSCSPSTARCSPGTRPTPGGGDARRDRGHRRLRPAAPPLRRRARPRRRRSRVVLSDGTVAKAGGKVIKNVAGYDLAKLFAGSFGTLGLIATISVRLHPRPPRPPPRTASSDDPDALAARRRDARAAARSRPTASTSPGRTAPAACSSASAGATAAERARETAARRARGRRGRPRTTTRCGPRSARASARADGAVLKVSGAPDGPAGRDPRRRGDGATVVSRAALGLSLARASRPATTSPSASRPSRAALAPRALHGARRRRARIGDPWPDAGPRAGRDGAPQGALRPGPDLPSRQPSWEASDATTAWDDAAPARARPDQRLRALRLLPADVPELRGLRGRDGLAARAHPADADRPRGGRADLARDGHALRPLPRLHGVRDRLPVGRPVRQADRGACGRRSSAREARTWRSAPTARRSSRSSPTPAACARWCPGAKLGAEARAARADARGCGRCSRSRRRPRRWPPSGGCRSAKAPRRRSSAAPSPSCRAASSASSSATSTPRPCACSPPRAGRSTRRAQPRCCGALQLHSGVEDEALGAGARRRSPPTRATTRSSPTSRAAARR